MSFKRVIKGILALAVLGVCGVAALVAAVWWEHGRSSALPEPSGPLAVGRATFDWVNPAETEELAPQQGAKREVVAWIWYPAEATSAAKPAEYLPGPWRVALRQYAGPVNDLLTHDLAKVRTHSFADAELSAAEPSYPVVVMRAGLGALTTDYTTLAEDLASHGYVVVGFDAPYRTGVVVFPDGRVVTRRREDNPETLSSAEAEKLAERLLVLWCNDTRFVVNQLERLNKGELRDEAARKSGGRFTGRLDMEHLGMFGHSFGGAQAAEFCREDARCRAGIDMDGRPFGKVVEAGLQRPFLFLMSDHRREEASPEGQRIMSEIRSIYNSLPPKQGALIAVRGTNHFSFSDQILLKSQIVLGALRLVGIAGDVDGKRGLRITTAYVSAFFNEYLKGKPQTLNEISGQYLEVTMEMR